MSLPVSMSCAKSTIRARTSSAARHPGLRSIATAHPNNAGAVLPLFSSYNREKKTQDVDILSRFVTDVECSNTDHFSAELSRLFRLIYGSCAPI